MAPEQLRAYGRARGVLLAYLCEPWSWTSAADLGLLVFTASGVALSGALLVVGVRVFRGTLPS